MTGLTADLRFAVRILLKQRALTASALATIALALAANTAIFTLVWSVLLRPLPLPHPDRLVRIEEWHSGSSSNLTGATFNDLSARARTFSVVGAFRLSSPGLATGGMPEQVLAADVSRSYFDVLGVPPMLGRGFEAHDFAPGARRAVVLTHELWRRLFGSDPGAIGRTVLINAVPSEVIGVMPANFYAPGAPQIWLPLTPAATLVNNRRAHLFTTLGRVRPDATLAVARHELEAITGQIVAESGRIDPDLRLGLTPLQQRLTQSIRPALLMLWVAVGLLLVVGATNVANLLLMQGSARAREISIRSALGAPRWRIVRQFASEALLLGIVGGALGSLLGFWSVPALRSLLPSSLASTRLSVGFDTVVFAVALSIVTALIFGIVPAFRSGSGPAADALRDRQDDVAARSWLRTAFVTAQVALTVILLTGAALLARSFLIVTRVDPGFDPEGTLAFDLTLPSASYPDAEAHAAFLTRVAENIGAIPGVIAAGASGALPMSGTASTGMVPEGGNPDSALVADVIPVSTGSLESLRIPLKAGRPFSPKDDARGMPVMLVSELAARTIWPRESNPIGRRVTMLDWGEPYTAEIVGVVGDVHQSGPEADIAPAVYYPIGQFPQTLLRYSIVLRTAGDPFAVAAAAREQVWRVDRNQPIASMRTMTQTLSAAVAQRRFNLVMIGAFSVAALGLAAIGLYGILAFAVNGRTREIGVRMALGAKSSDVARLVWNQGARPVLIGLIVGLTCALLASRTVRSLLFGIEGIDALTTVIVGSVILLAAVAASAGPVRRAIKIDPAAVLRG